MDQLGHVRQSSGVFRISCRYHVVVRLLRRQVGRCVLELGPEPLVVSRTALSTSANERPGVGAGWRVLFTFQPPLLRITQAER
jgi:hypothetical protein